MPKAATLATALLSTALLAFAVYGVVRLGTREHDDPARCSRGLVATTGRCCAGGQRVVRGHCVGQPIACAFGMHLASDETGCVVDARRIRLRGGRLSFGAEDWQAEGVTPRDVTVAPFEMDADEVTIARWSHCVQAGICRALATIEPGLPATNVDGKEAARFCRFEGGRLPSGDEWLFAALGEAGRRFPWGETGLVCRRAAFGLVSGPCARGGGLELAGSRPDGATPDGVEDLAGNAAEWTLERDGTYLSRGGSFASRAAAELKSWSAVNVRGKRPDTGFRCAYAATAAIRRAARTTIALP